MLSVATLERLTLSYTSGVLAAVSPCVIVLIPLAMYRFVHDGAGHSAGASAAKTQNVANGNGNGHGHGHDAASASASASAAHHKAPSQVIPISLFVLGFQISYLLFGFVLSRVLTSSIQNGFRLGLGALFVVVCLLSVTHHLDPLRLPLFSNTFLMGVSFALLVSFNPCTVPFLGVVISLNTADAMLCLTAFGQGLLTPSLIFVAVGRRFTRFLKRGGRSMHLINTLMSYLLGLSGLYLLLDRGGVAQALAAIGRMLPAWLAPADDGSGGGGGSPKILEAGDVAVMSAMWCAAVLLAVQSMEVMDLTGARIWRMGWTFARRKFVILCGAMATAVALFAAFCLVVAQHNPRAHRDWAGFLSTVVSVSDTQAGADAAADSGSGKPAAAATAAAAAAASAHSSAPCVDTSGLHCEGCDQCLHAYCVLVGALAAYVFYVHFVLWPKWLAAATSGAATSSLATDHAPPSAVVDTAALKGHAGSSGKGNGIGHGSPQLTLRKTAAAASAVGDALPPSESPSPSPPLADLTPSARNHHGTYHRVQSAPDVVSIAPLDVTTVPPVRLCEADIADG